MQINQKKAEEYVPELSLPMLKSQSLGTLEQRSPKNSISSMLKKSNKKK